MAENLTSHGLLTQKREEEKRLAREREQRTEMQTLESLLAACGLEEHAASLAAKTDLNDLQSRLAANRPLFLDYVKELGITNLPARQKLAVTMAKAEKAGQLPAPTLDLPHLRPAVFEEEDGRVSARLKLPAGTTTNQLKIKIDFSSLRVEYCGGPTAASGKLFGQVAPAECDWQIERTPAPEYDPLLGATEQPPPPEDTLLISLVKAKTGRWRSLFSDTLATRHVPPPAEEDEKIKAIKAERQKLRDQRAKEMLYGMDITPMPPKPPELVAIETRERLEKARKRERRREGESMASAPVRTASECWQPALAMLVWREGLERVPGRPDHPEESGPLFEWLEDERTLVVKARTAAGMSPSALKLDAGTNFVECSVRGIPTAWCGVLVGRIDPARSKLEVIPDEDARSPTATLQLTLVKAEARRLWRAPWPELAEQVDARERRAARMGDKPRREQVKVGGFDEVERQAEWQIVMPYRAGGPLVADDLRVAVSPTSLNVHIAGQEDAPFISGQLAGRIVPAKCTWRVRAAQPIGTVQVEEMVITLAKEGKAMWHSLLREQYV